jgi:hypothetical protein
MMSEEEPSIFKFVKVVVTIFALVLLLFVSYNIAIYTNSSESLEVLAEKNY